jgi:hypothetical protein
MFAYYKVDIVIIIQCMYLVTLHHIAEKLLIWC